MTDAAAPTPPETVAETIQESDGLGVGQGETDAFHLKDQQGADTSSNPGTAASPHGEGLGAANVANPPSVPGNVPATEPGPSDHDPRRTARDEIDTKIWWMLSIFKAAGGTMDATDCHGHWLNFFCDDRGKDTDTFNIAIDRKLIACGHDSDSDVSTAMLLPAGLAFIDAQHPAATLPVPHLGAAARTASIPLADHGEISRLVLGQPWEIQKQTVTIAAHCQAIVDEAPSAAITDLAGCISQCCYDLVRALSPVPTAPDADRCETCKLPRSHPTHIEWCPAAVGRPTAPDAGMREALEEWSSLAYDIVMQAMAEYAAFTSNVPTTRYQERQRISARTVSALRAALAACPVHIEGDE